jgi:hypothetical protein
MENDEKRLMTRPQYKTYYEEYARFFAIVDFFKCRQLHKKAPAADTLTIPFTPGSALDLADGTGDFSTSSM